MDEIQNIILNVQNAAKLKELTGELEKQKDVLKGLNERYQSGQLSQVTFMQAAEPFARRIRDINGELAELNKHTRGTLSPHGLMAISYAFDDLANTSGSWAQKLSAISNNLPGIIAGLGVSGGLAAVLPIVGTAAIALLGQWDNLMAAFGSEKISDAERGLDKLIAKAKEGAAEFERLRAAPTTDDEAKGAANLAKSLRGANADKIAAGLAAGLEKSGKGEQPNGAEARGMAGGFREDIVRQKVLGLIGAGVDPAQAEEMVANAKDEIDQEVRAAEQAVKIRLKEANQARARELVAGLTKPNQEGANARATVRPFVDANPGAFPAGFLGDLADADPDQVAAQRELEARGRANAEAMGKRWKGQDENRKRADRFNKGILRAPRDDQDKAHKKAAAEDAARDRDDLAGEREAEADRRKAAAEAAAKERAARIEERQRPFREAADAVRDFGNANGISGSATDVDELARDVVGLQRQGLATNDALLMAFRSRIEEIQQLQGRLMQQQAQAQQLGGLFGGGGNFGGGYSMMPMTGY